MPLTSAPRTRYAIVGTGSRAGTFAKAITTTYADDAEPAAFCADTQPRTNWYNPQLAKGGGRAVPTYPAEQFDQMTADTKPDTVVVATIDSTHHIYITRAMDQGCDVITEKPMTT